MKLTAYYVKKPLRLRSLLLLAALSTIGMGSAQGGIIANFTDGNSSSYVDAWKGMPGQGWSNAWYIGNNSNATASASVVPTNPLNAGGNYLAFNFVSTTTNRAGTISRGYESFGDVDVTKVRELSFNFRMDSYESLRFVSIFESNLSGQLINDSTNTNWAIQYNTSSNSWLFGDGGGYVSSGSTVGFIQAPVDSNVNLFVSDVYGFKVVIDSENSRYMVTVTNLDYEGKSRSTGLSTYTSSWLSFDLKESSLINNLTFSIRNSAASTSAFSIDGILIENVVIPEPSSFALLGVGVGLLGLKVRALKRVRGR